MSNRVDMMVLTGHHRAQVYLWKPKGITPPTLNPGSYGGWTCLDMETIIIVTKKSRSYWYFSQKLFSNFRTQRTQDMTELPQTSLQTGCKVTSLSKNRHIFLIAWKVFWWDNRSIFGYTKICDSIKGHNLNLQLITSLEVSVIYKVS